MSLSGSGYATGDWRGRAADIKRSRPPLDVVLDVWVDDDKPDLLPVEETPHAAPVGQALLGHGLHGQPIYGHIAKTGAAEVAISIDDGLGSGGTRFTRKAEAEPKLWPPAREPDGNHPPEHRCNGPRSQGDTCSPYWWQGDGTPRGYCVNHPPPGYTKGVLTLAPDGTLKTVTEDALHES